MINVHQTRTSESPCLPVRNRDQHPFASSCICSRWQFQVYTSLKLETCLFSQAALRSLVVQVHHSAHENGALTSTIWLVISGKAATMLVARILIRMTLVGLSTPVLSMRPMRILAHGQSIRILVRRSRASARPSMLGVMRRFVKLAGCS